MKRIAVLSLLVTTVLLVVLSGCTTSQPAPQVPVATAVVTTAPTPAPTPVPDPYPNASPLNKPVAFGAATKTGEIMPTAYKVKPTFSWTDPSWNSPREQAESQQGTLLETQKGYNIKKPAGGNTFIFVYLNVVATGTEAVWAPSPNQIVVYYDGKTYPYTPLASAETTVDAETSNQYDYELGSGGTGGYVQTGKSNTVRGFLIYEIPASFVPEKTYVIVTPDGKSQGVWRLA